MKRDFSGKTVVVTGAASGIGLAVCREFAAHGAGIGMLDMEAAALEKAAAALEDDGASVMAVPCDVTSKTACDNAMQTVIHRFGGIDVLFNNAGITQRSGFVPTDTAVYERVMAVNFFGALYCTKAAVNSIIQRRGMIIANESIAGIAPLPGRTGYSASKHAMHGFFTSLRCEVRHLGVHVMIVCPGFIRTNLQTRALGADGTVTTRPQSRVGRQDTPEHVARQIYTAACRGKNMLVLTAMGRLGCLISRLAPVVYERIVTRQFKSEIMAAPPSDPDSFRPG